MDMFTWTKKAKIVDTEITLADFIEHLWDKFKDNTYLSVDINADGSVSLFFRRRDDIKNEENQGENR